MDFLFAFRRLSESGTRIFAVRGFTLIEVVIAMGIFVFAVLPVIGLVSSGMKTMRQSMDDSVRADILKNIVAQIQATPYTNISSTYNGVSFYFTDQGVLTNSSAAIFVAIPAISSAPTNVTTNSNIACLLKITVSHCLDTNNKTVFSQLLLNSAK